MNIIIPSWQTLIRVKGDGCQRGQHSRPGMELPLKCELNWKENATYLTMMLEDLEIKVMLFLLMHRCMSFVAGVVFNNRKVIPTQRFDL